MSLSLSANLMRLVFKSIAVCLTVSYFSYDDVDMVEHGDHLSDGLSSVDDMIVISLLLLKSSSMPPSELLLFKAASSLNIGSLGVLQNIFLSFLTGASESLLKPLSDSGNFLLLSFSNSAIFDCTLFNRQERLVEQLSFIHAKFSIFVFLSVEKRMF
jgi:hypothetical protein